MTETVRPPKTSDKYRGKDILHEELLEKAAKWGCSVSEAATRMKEQSLEDGLIMTAKAYDRYIKNEPEG